MKIYEETYQSAKEQTKSVNQSRKRVKEPTKSDDLKITKEQNVSKKASKKANETDGSTKDLDAADMAFNSMIAGFGARFDTHIGRFQTLFRESVKMRAEVQLFEKSGTILLNSI